MSGARAGLIAWTVLVIVAAVLWIASIKGRFS
jgi:hypothetical protein